MAELEFRGSKVIRYIVVVNFGNFRGPWGRAKELRNTGYGIKFRNIEFRSLQPNESTNFNNYSSILES